ncbi:MAG: hypothetical protein WC811_02205 [Hyphomicrobium sp.]|jgi:hypothetical protein
MLSGLIFLIVRDELSGCPAEGDVIELRVLGNTTIDGDDLDAEQVFAVCQSARGVSAALFEKVAKCCDKTRFFVVAVSGSRR